MSDTKTIYELAFRNAMLEPSDAERERITAMVTRAREAAEGDGNDEEIDALNELIDELLSFASIEVEESEVPECDECEEIATNFWPNLTEPVQLCDSCTHNARRSGWEPGQ